MGYAHIQLITTHFSKAVAREASVVRYIAILMKGYASPSFEADSATRSWRRREGTFLTANLPPSEHLSELLGIFNRRYSSPMIAAETTGSVGVKHAEMTSEDTKFSFGKRT